VRGARAGSLAPHERLAALALTVTGSTTLLALTLLWPVFPASIIFNALIEQLRFAPLRAIVTIAWPLAGVLLLPDGGLAETLAALPVTVTAAAMQAAALFTAFFYAWRSLTVNDLSRWARLIGTSALALLWLPWSAGAGHADLAAGAIALGSACAVLHLVALALARRFGSDYLGQGRVGPAHPLLAAMVAVSVLAALCAPPFPGFFSMIFILARVPWWAQAGAAMVWWLWSWSGARVWQRAFYGAPVARTQGRDLGAGTCAVAGVLASIVTLAAYAWSTAWIR